MSDKTKPKKNYGNRIDQIDKIAEKVRGKLKPIPNEKLPEIMELLLKREEALEHYDQGTNDVDRKERKFLVLEIHKELLTAYGLKPCAATDCTKWVPPGRSKYCSCSYGDRQKVRNNRERDPKGHLRAKLNYLKDLEKEGDLKKDN